MKQCPVCQSTYTDDSLIYCLNDGGKLFSPSSTAATQEMRFGDGQTFSGNQKTFDNFDSAPTVVVQKKSKSLNLIILLAIFSFAALLMGGIWLTRYYVLERNARESEFLKSGQDPAEKESSEETRELRERLEELQKQVERQNTANKNPSPAPSATAKRNEESVSGTVDSPNDGFLALRSAPNHKTGEQILQIPHRTVIFVYNCQNTTNVAGRRGRWCETTYAGKTGWIFDGFLIY